MTTVFPVKVSVLRFWIDDDSIHEENISWFKRWNAFRDKLLNDPGINTYAFFEKEVRQHLTLDSNKSLVRLSRNEGVVATGQSNQCDKQICIYGAPWYSIDLRVLNPEDDDAPTWTEDELKDLTQAWVKAFVHEIDGGPCIHGAVIVASF